MDLRSRKLKFFFKDHWPKMLLLAAVLAGIFWFARATFFAMEFTR